MLSRDVIIAALGNVPADIDVIPYARSISPPAKTTVMVRLDKVRPSGAGGSWDVEASLVIIAAKVTPGAADDELDAALQDVLYLLDTDDAASALLWTEATRATYAPEDEPTNPAYEVAVITRIQKEQ